MAGKINRWNMIKPKLLRALVPTPLKASHVELSLIASAHDEPGHPTEWLLETSLRAIEAARSVQLDDISSRIKDGPDYPSVWPGEHYKLLAGFVRALQPVTIVEIGTFRGLSTLALAKYLPAGGKVVTFDVVPWHQVETTAFRESDFDGPIRQINEDLADLGTARRHADLLCSADLFFIDAAKDGVMERHFLANLETLGLKPDTLVIFDDTRLWNMLDIWRDIRYPKLDLTSFGHWSGTGVIHWNPSSGRRGRAGTSNDG